MSTGQVTGRRRAGRAWPSATFPVTMSVMENEWRTARLLPAPQPAGPEPRAAVLACLYPERGSVRLLLIKRPVHMPTHGGDLAFPGGKPQPGETPLRTALREAEEEVGVKPDEVEVLGYLPDIHTVTYVRMVTPVVGRLPAPPVLTPDPGEVAAVFTPPLDVFRDEAGWRTEDWGNRVVHFFDLGGETLWGATARMVRRLVGLDNY